MNNEKITESKKQKIAPFFKFVDPVKFGDPTQQYTNEKSIEYLELTKNMIDAVLEQLTEPNQYQPKIDVKLPDVFEKSFTKPIDDDEIDVYEFFRVITKEISAELTRIHKIISDMNKRFDEKWHEIEEIKKGISNEYL
ncbi:hypothetical protein ISS30_01405 [bacterium]|nr:hypothetical protein [Bacteroidota bacterium]MBL7190326.1 hypothetical protein [bacterium]